MPELYKELEEQQKHQTNRERQLLKEEVTEEEIGEIVSKWTGIPVTRLMENEKKKLLNLENVLHKRVIGQDEAVTAVADAVLRASQVLRMPENP